MYELKKKLERNLRVNLLAPRPSSYKKRIYRAAGSQRLRNTDVRHTHTQINTDLLRFVNGGGTGGI
jgi:hypothetical protein